MIRTIALTLAAATGAQAAPLAPPPDATPTLSEETPLDGVRVATGPFSDTLPSVMAEGAVTRRVWQLPDPGSSLAITRPLREALVAEGWKVVFECAARDCGGFGFRFEIDVAPAPDMFVDLADYRYLSARRGEAWTILIASRSGARGYLQATEVTPVAGAPAAPDPEGEAPPREAGLPETTAPRPDPVMRPDPSDLAVSLRRTGRAVLSGLDFATGSTALDGGDYPSLAALAAYLEAEPDVNVALVGHTDAVGSAEGNMAISRARAQSARDLLIRRYGTAPGRVAARGVGPYAPLADNATEEGRRANRRVEAVVTSTP